MNSAYKRKKSYDLSDFAVDDTVPLHQAAPEAPAEAPEPVVRPQAAPAPQPVALAAPAVTPAAPVREPEPFAAMALPPAVPAMANGRAGRVPTSFWITMELRRAIRQAMVGRLEGVYRSQGDLVEAAVRRFLNLG